MTANLQRALLLLGQSRHELAERELRLALAAEPDNAMAHAVLGLCLSEAERHDEAIREAGEAIRLAPDQPFSHYALARILQARDRLDPAAVAIDEAIRLDPEDPDHFAVLASIRFDQRRWRQGLEAADAGLRLDPEHVDCTNLRAMALVQLGQREEAAATIGGALARDPDNAITHANQGWSLLHGGQHARALEHFREALRLDPELEWARQGLVEALKARSAVYGLLLRYFLWMSRLDRRAQWAVLIVGYVGYQVLRGLLRANPALGPVIWPLIIAYGVFAVSTWIADPLFTLLLRLDRFGRLVVSRDEVVASNWVGGSLALALVAVGGWLLSGSSTLLLAALLFGALVLPLAGTFQLEPGRPRRLMIKYTAVVAALGLIGLGLQLLGVLSSGSGLSTRATSGGSALVTLSTLGSFLSTWVAQVSAMRGKH